MIRRLFESSLFKNTGIYTLTSILNSAIPFLLLPILTRFLTPEDYGIVSMFMLLVSFVSPFIGLSINGAVTRKYYDQEDTDIWEYVYNCFLILISSTFVVSLVFLFFSKYISNISSFPMRYLWMVVVYSFCQIFSSILLVLWQVQKKPFHYGLFNNLQTLVNVGLSILFVVVINMGWQGRILGQLIAVILFAIFSFVILSKNNWIKIRFNKRYVLNALIFGVPLIPHVLSSSIISMTDRFFITNMVGLAATGVYTVGYQIGSIINLFSSSFNNAYVPWLFENLKENNYKTKLKIVKFTYLYFVGILLLALLFGLLAPYFLRVFLGKSFNESGSYVLWVALGYAFNGMYFMVVNYIFYSQKTKLLASVTFMTAILNILLNYFFIKVFGAIGAAQATTLVFAIKFFVVWALAAKAHKMPWRQIFIK